MSSGLEEPLRPAVSSCFASFFVVQISVIQKGLDDVNLLQSDKMSVAF